MGVMIWQFPGETAAKMPTRRELRRAFEAEHLQTSALVEFDAKRAVEASSIMTVTVEFLATGKVTVSEQNGVLAVECDRHGRQTAPDWCFHIYATVCNDASAVRPSQHGNLREAHAIIARHVEIVPVLTARLAEATKHGGNLREVQALEAAIASLTEHRQDGMSSG